MSAEIIVTNIFRLADGLTVLACEGLGDLSSLTGRQAALVAGSQVRQEFVIAGERVLLNQKTHENERAIETREQISITLEEAQSKAFKLNLV